MFNAWQSVKVDSEGSEHHGRAGVVIRPEGVGYQVQLDDVGDKPKIMTSFTADELKVLL